jgi:hypothetical protein
MALAPSLGSDVSARKNVECTNGGGHDKDCDSPATKNIDCSNPRNHEVNCGNLDD